MISAKVSSPTSAKIANMSFVCAMLVVCHHFAVPDVTGSFLWWVGAVFGQGDMAHGGGLSHFSVPWFFVVSGFFLAGHMGEQGWWRRETLKRVKTLLVPFLFWTVAAIILLTLMDLLAGRKPYFSSLAAIANGIGFYPFCVMNPMESQLWYVRVLFLFVVLSPLIYRFVGWTWIAVTFVLYLIIAPFDGAVMHPIFRYGFSLEGLFYFSTGVVLRLRPVKINLRKVGVVSLLAGLGLVVLHSTFLCISSPLSDYVKWLSTPLFVLGFFAVMPETKWPVWLVSCAFPIYVMHRIFLWPFYGLARAMHWGGASIGWWFVQLSVGVVSPIAFAAAMRKLMPKFANVIFGGR